MVAVMALSVSGYLASRHSTNQQGCFGDSTNPNRVEVTVWITRVDGRLEMHALTADGAELPVDLTVLNTDPFFGITTTAGTAPAGGAVVNLGIHRSAPTLIFAVFIMVLMLGLASGAVVAAFYVLTGGTARSSRLVR